MERLYPHCRSLIFAALSVCLVVTTSVAGNQSKKPQKAAGADSKKTVNQSDTTQKPEKALPALPLQLTDGTKTEVTYTWRELESGRALISIWNSSKEQLKITAAVADFDLSAGSTAQGASSISLTVSPDSTTSLKYGVTRFTLRLKDPATVPAVRGSYSGLLLLSGEGDKFSPFSQRVRINVTGPQPAVTKASLVAWRFAPFLPVWCASINVPLNDEYKPAEFTEPERVVGFVHRAYGGIATVRWATLKPAHDNKPAQARLTIASLPAAGQYDGEVYLGGLQDKTAPLALTVIAKDVPVFPIMVMALGIFLAWLTKRYLGVLRSTWNLRKQEAELGRTFQESQTEFAEAVAGKSCASYSIAEDVASQRKNILQNLTMAERSWATSLDNNQNYKNAQSAIQSLQDQLSQWAKTGSELASLDASLQELQQHIDGAGMLPASSSPGDPAFLPAAQNLLRGQPLKTAEIPALRKDVSDAKTTAMQFDSANQHALELTDSFRKTQGRSDLDEDTKSKLTDIQNRLVAAWQHLWEVQTAGDEAAVTNVGGDLDQAQIELAQIAAEPEKPRTFGIMSFASYLLSPTNQWPGPQILTAAADLDHPAASDTRRAEVLDRGIRLGDLGSVIIASVIALVTGLSSSYLGKAFGTVQDYFALFVWAAGSKVGLDILTAALDKLVASAPVSKSS